MAVITSGFIKSQKRIKKTCQGSGRGTKFGTKPEGKACEDIRASQRDLQTTSES